MKLKLVLASLVASTLAVPTLAQTPGTSPSSPSTFGGAGTWYVVQDNSTMKCEVTSIKAVPGGTTKAVGKKSYNSKSEAEADLGKIPECSK